MKITPRQLRYINFFVASGLSSAYIIGKTLNAQNLKDKLERKVENKALPVPPKIKRLINEVLEDMKLDEEDKLKIEPFMCINNDIRHVGFSALGYGAYLGIPQNFLFDDNNPMDFIVEIDGKEMPKNASEFQDLKRVMCLSDDAKKFAIAQEIYLSQHKDIVPFGILPLTIVVKCCIFSFAIEKGSPPSFGRVKRSPINFHYILFLMGAWFYSIAYDIFSVFGDAESDFCASKLGESYVKGGIEYYSKMIKRNKILKKLNKNAPYSESGDLQLSLIRTNHMSLPLRLIYLNNIKNGEEESIWKYVFHLG